jgi:hypothetical protein
MNRGKGFRKKTLEEVKELQRIKLQKSLSGPSSPRKSSSLKTAQLRKAKKPSVAKLKKEADMWFSRYIRLRDSDKNGIGECITCGEKKPWRDLQNGHFVGRRSYTMRFDELNCNAQCMGCNVYKHGDLYTYAKNLDLKYGDGTAEALHQRRFDTHKFTVDEVQKVIDDSKEYVLGHANYN